MRDADRQEAAAFGQRPRDALRNGIIAGPAFTALVRGVPEAMFGWVVTSALDSEGRPWMLGTDAIYQHGRALLALGPEWLRLMFDSIAHASNVVSADNARAIRLLERWGFVVEQGETMIGGVPFRTFWKERGNV